MFIHSNLISCFSNFLDEKMANHVDFESIEHLVRKNVYCSETAGD